MTTRETHLESYALDQYEVLAYIAAGGFAEVYRAKDMRSGEEVALKVLKPTEAQKPDAVKRFNDEALHTSLFHQPQRHPHLIEVKGRGECNGYHYIAMPYLRGETLEQRLKRGALPPAEVARVISAVANALDHAHVKHRRVHRDVKPSNIFLTADGGVILMDFGLVREQKGLDITATMTIIGTPQYMSPEQIKGKGISFKCDTYALAHVTYEALCGKPAFPNTGDQFGVMWAQVNSPPPPLNVVGLSPDRAAAVKAVVSYALEKDPASRYDTAGQFAMALSDSINSGRVTQPPLKPVPRPVPVPPPQHQAIQRTPPQEQSLFYGALLVGLAALFVLGTMAWLATSADRSPTVSPPRPTAVSVVVNTREPESTSEPATDAPVPPPEAVGDPAPPVSFKSGTVEGKVGGGATLLHGQMEPDTSVSVTMRLSPCNDEVTFFVKPMQGAVVNSVHEGACRAVVSFSTAEGGPVTLSIANTDVGSRVDYEIEAVGFRSLQ